MSSNVQHEKFHPVHASDAHAGKDGEKLLAHGENVAMRIWQDEEAGTAKPEHQNPYEYVAYVVSGKLEIKLAGKTHKVGKGDSYCIPANTPYTLQILEKATVVEAVTPSDRLHH
jgi:quercetin dioxygenase-like cupin family protein